MKFISRFKYRYTWRSNGDFTLEVWDYSEHWFWRWWDSTDYIRRDND